MTSSQTSRLMALAIGLLASYGLFGQTLNGRVTSMQAVPVSGAYVVHLDSEHHAHTDETGNFVLTGVKVGDKVQVVHVGYEVTTVTVEDLSVPLKIKIKEKLFELDEVVIGNDIKSINSLTAVELQVNPVNSAQEVLRVVPGLFIGQHAGGGKAEQIFLRGFDIDHGTDVRITVDGMPVNMVSHAHGQGYADLHFVIPETIENVDFGKGPYYTQQGNFATAGYVDFRSKRRLDNSSIMTSVGSFNTLRTLGLLDLLSEENQDAYMAIEYMATDGPFESSQNFNRLNLLGKYHVNLSESDDLEIGVSYFTSKWDASGQIPVRAVESGLITRFGAIDDTEGGSTSRANVNFRHFSKIDDKTFIRNTGYLSNYDFELYSNFTFFLNDPVNGDQIRQRESRLLAGFESEVNRSWQLGQFDGGTQVGVGLRYDNVDDNELSRTRIRRETLSQVQFGDIDESNYYAYVNFEAELNKWFVNAGVRLDYFKFDYVDRLDSLYDTQSRSRVVATPKFNLLYNQTRNLQFFLKSGVGFHSNDTRTIIQEETDEIIPLAYGADLGVIWKATPRLVFNAALWYLHLEQEFVYVGDEGIVEPSGRTNRRGVDAGLRYQLTDWLFLTSDVNFAVPRNANVPSEEKYIPLAPTLTNINSLSFRTAQFTGGVETRYIADRPANEDNSIVAKGYFVADANINWTWQRFTLGARVENLFDTEWEETQFATESRLFNEPESVEEIHFTPGTSRFVSFSLQYTF